MTSTTESSPLMLGVSGMRGIVGGSLTPDLVASYAGSFAAYLRDSLGRTPKVVVGRDGRAGGEAVQASAVAGLLSAGADVLDAGVAMTPTMGVLTDRLGADAGVIITASHNPQPWNGVKFLLPTAGGRHAAAPAAALASKIIERFMAGPVAWAESASVGKLEAAHLGVDEHIGLVLDRLSELEGGSAAEPGEGMKVVLDSVNASGIGGGRRMLEELGCEEILHLGAEPTGLFPHEPEPTAENLVSVAEAVREAGAAVGFAQDPDADRLALIDDRGTYIGEEYTLALCAMSVLEALKGAGKAGDAVLAANLSTSRMVDDLAERYGARVVRTPVGEANVVEAMLRERAVLGGEGNGGVIWPGVTLVRDSLSAMALVLSLLARTGEPLSGVVSGLPSYAIVKSKTPIPSREAADPAIEKVASAFGSHRVDLQDGVRVDLESERAWVQVRASNTEPIMRLIAEAPTRARAEALVKEAEAAIAGG
ncbi:MAG: phosphoglucosamine mutase [Phycisphaerales bacterium]|nr:MAG: phosphoglucosamine mutase [Phycisphaerales bacterium]